MTSHKRHIWLTAMLAAAVLQLPAADVARYVNPFIGTGAIEGGLSGNNYPGATMPFGMVQLSPDTREVPDWDCAAGYDYNDDTIYGFSHTRLSGTGASDFIDILVLPVKDRNRTSSGFSHNDESASTGYYQVLLKDENINAELTATRRVGLHRYTFGDTCTGSAAIRLDLDHSANKNSWGRKIIASQIRVVAPDAVEGYRIITGWARLRKIYFRMEFSCPVAEWVIDNGGTITHNSPVANGTALKALFDFGHQSVVECRVAISPVSIDNARLNMQTETAGKSFDTLKNEAYEAWNKQLGKIEIEASEHEKEIFYTALYHTMIQPNLMSDCNGQYMAADYATRQLADGDEHYSTFSLWDTFRAAHPLYTIIEPELTARFVASMIRQYDYYGYLPVWQLWGQDNYCMIGNHAVPVIADAILKGIPGIDSIHAYEAVKASLTTPHLNSPFDVWEKYGYMPEDLQSQSVSITLEQSFDDWCAARLAQVMGETDDMVRFDARAQYYRNLHDTHGTGFFRSRNSRGEWIEPFDPYKYGANGGYPFTEGNAWQYYWYVPHDVEGLIELTGGKKAFCNKLDEFFTSTVTSGQKNDNASGFVGLYAHGNEPSHHVAYLYTLAGQPHKTQQLVNHIMRTLYNTSSSGYAGNDDCGEMSAWYIFSALGFYPVNPASGEYIIGSPLIDRAAINVGNGRKFEIIVHKESDENAIYVDKITINGKEITDFKLPHKAIVDGGTLQIWLTSK